MALTQKERSAMFYKNRKDNGLCPRCGKILDREGHYCSECLEKVNEYKRENREFYRENGICPVCGKEGNDGKFCKECGAKKPEDEVWTCPSCGATGNDGKFCKNCGAKRG